MIGKRRLQGNTECDWMNPLSRKFKMNQSDVFLPLVVNRLPIVCKGGGQTFVTLLCQEMVICDFLDNPSAN